MLLCRPLDLPGELLIHFTSSAGATGHVGNIIALQLSKCGVNSAALVRASQTDSNGREDALRKLRSADIRIIEGSPDDDQDKLADLLRAFDTVVTAIAGKPRCCMIKVLLALAVSH